jgi:hypothetical protein
MTNRYGLLNYSTSYNLGDEIQSIAASRFLPRIDAIVDRDSGRNDSIDKLKTIYNGWFDGHYCAFPPPDNIEPLFVSFHINEQNHSDDSAYDVLTANTYVPIASHVSYLKRFEPIGCRDFHTVQMLQRSGVDAYFSGCLTMTLRNKFTTRTDEILVVDSHIMFRDLYETIVPQSIRDSADYLSQALENYIPSHDEKMRMAQSLLDRLAQAKLVITSRLHTVLPCIAYNTPVVFLHENLNDVRFTGLLEYIPCLTTGDEWCVKNPLAREKFDGIVRRLNKTVSKWVTKPVRLEEGTSIITACMNRANHVAIALPTWLAMNPDEIIIVDWHSKPALTIPPHPKIKLIVIDNVEEWILSKAMNLAARFARYDKLLKLDCDSVLNSTFLTSHQLEPSSFFAGDYRRARNENERHTNGIVYVWTRDFFDVGGYNELITTYGYDDCDLYNRLTRISRNRRAILLDLVQHVPHSNSLRTENQRLRHELKVEIEKNRQIARLDLWQNHSQSSTFIVKKRSNSLYSGHYVAGPILHESVVNDVYSIALRNASPNRMWIEPKNGLGNRLRALASAYNIARATARQLSVLWIPDIHCAAKFDDLYRVNFLFASTHFTDKRPVAWPASQTDTDYNAQSTSSTYISSACSLISPYTDWKADSLFLNNLILTDDIAEKVYEFERSHDTRNAIGVHIRMGQCSIENPSEDVSSYSDESRDSIRRWRAGSHWTIFDREMREILKSVPHQKFFVCCDRRDVYDALRDMEHVWMYEKTVFDRSVAQVKLALIDLYLLAKTKYILGSNWSSFTELAHRLNGRELKLAGVDF